MCEFVKIDGYINITIKLEFHKQTGIDDIKFWYD